MNCCDSSELPGKVLRSYGNVLEDIPYWIGYG